MPNGMDGTVQGYLCGRTDSVLAAMASIAALKETVTLGQVIEYECRRKARETLREQYASVLTVAVGQLLSILGTVNVACCNTDAAPHRALHPPQPPGPRWHGAKLRNIRPDLDPVVIRGPVRKPPRANGGVDSTHPTLVNVGPLPTTTVAGAHQVWWLELKKRGRRRRPVWWPRLNCSAWTK